LVLVYFSLVRHVYVSPTVVADVDMHFAMAGLQINFAGNMAGRRGEALNLTEDEVAFYDALETNDSAVKVLGDEAPRTIARELVATVRANVTIDWTVRENIRAQLRVLVKRILRKYGYPPDKQEMATETVLEQAALTS
jgi:type I restriction enzyme R subunit